VVNKQPLQNIERARVVRVSEDWDQHDVVGDVEIGVPGSDKSEIQRLGRRDFG